jgi:Ser/Thr protein kinase RdoA (MazF antagonist)
MTVTDDTSVRRQKAGVGLERSWVTLRDSSAWRRMRQLDGVRRLQRTSSFGRLATKRRFVETALRHRMDTSRFDSVQTFCLLLGPVKSGGSLLGALLDAHPRIVLADEVGPLQYLDAGFGREQLFHLLDKGARREAMKGRVTARRLEPYSLAVPGQHQGHSEEVTVVGDSTAGPTTRLLGRRPELLGHLREVLGPVEDRYVHVVRDPLDPISAMVVRGGRSLDEAIDDFGGQCERIERLRDLIGVERLLTVHYEDLIARPEQQLQTVCRFLGVEPEAGYLSACGRVVDASRAGERRWVSWTPSARSRVEQLIARFPFLERYGGDGEIRGEVGCTDVRARNATAEVLDRPPRPVTRTVSPRLCLPRAQRLIDTITSTARKPAIDALTCARILDLYGLHAVGRPENASSGRRNSNVILRTTAGKVVLRRHRETAPVATVRYEHAVLRELERRGFPAVRLRMQTGGGTVARLEDHTFALFDFEHGRSLSSCWMPPGERGRVLVAAGRTLAEMHRVLADFVPGERHHLEHPGEDGQEDGTLDWHLATLAGLPALPLPGAGSGHPTLVDGRRERIAARLAELDETLQGAALPTVVIHGDFGLHNLLVAPEGTFVVHDLELARRDWRLIDLVIVLSRSTTEEGRSFLTGYCAEDVVVEEELPHFAAVWEHYHLSGAIRSWSNYERYGGDQRLTTAAQRLSRATRVPEDVMAPWC